MAAPHVLHIDPAAIGPTAPAGEDCAAGGTCDLIPAEVAHAHATLFKALADPTRIRLLHHVAASPEGTACACHLPESLGISQPTLSHHLKKLVEAGLLTREQRGRWAHYTVSQDALARARAALTPTC